MRAGWGGRRIGSGRKPSADVLPHPSSAAMLPPPDDGDGTPVEPFEPSASLTPDARAVWDVQSPHAFKQGTLTRASAFAFERYCEVCTLERRAARREPGGSDHRGLLKQVQAYEIHFGLIPGGRAMPDAPKVTTPARDDPDDAFFLFGDQAG